jgi:hypothetical protein
VAFIFPGNHCVSPCWRIRAKLKTNITASKGVIYKRMALPPHIPLAVRIFPHLVECATDGKTTNTEELSQYVRGETRLFSRSLQWIRDYVCEEHKLPPLTVVVENNGKDTPSNSFAPSKVGLDRAEYEKLRAQTLKEVYSYPRWGAVSENLQKMFSGD